jgi:hypothetical protein
VLSVATAVPACASTYYDYWSYWHKPPGATSWQYSTVGPSGYYLVKDKPQVEGWRFALGTASPSDPQPRPVSVTYDQYCSGQNTDKPYRVLLVVDYGTQSGAPSGPVYSCEGFDSQPNGTQVLTLHHTERDSGGLICGIDDYPHSGCGEVVSSPAPTRSPSHAPVTRSTSGAPPTTRTTTTAAPTTSGTASTTRPPTTPASRSAAARPTGTAGAVTTADSTASPSSSSDPAIVAKPFTPAAKSSASVTGFVGGCVLVAALVGAGILARRRRP